MKVLDIKFSCIHYVRLLRLKATPSILDACLRHAGVTVGIAPVIAAWFPAQHHTGTCLAATPKAQRQ